MSVVRLPLQRVGARKVVHRLQRSLVGVEGKERQTMGCSAFWVKHWERVVWQ